MMIPLPPHTWQTGLSILALVYFGCMIALGRLGYRLKNKTVTPTTFYLADRQLSASSMGIAFVAACFGAGSTLGTFQAFGQSGLLALWKVAMPLLLTCAVLYALMLPKLDRFKRLSKLPCDTLPEALACYYGGLGTLWFAGILWVASVTFVSSQMIAAIGLLKVLFPDTWGWAVAVGWTGLVSYITLGGFSAVVVTDTLQVALYGSGIGLLALSVILTYMGVYVPVAGFSQHWLSTSVAALPKALHWHMQWQFIPAGWQALLPFMAKQLGLITAWVIAPEMWQRMQATRSYHDAKQGLQGAWLTLVVLYACVLLICFGAWGLLVHEPQGLMAYHTTDVAHQKLTPLLYWLTWTHHAFQFPLPLLTLLLLGFLIALSSTMDSTLNVASQTLTQDMLTPYFRGSKVTLLQNTVLNPRVMTRVAQVTSVFSAAIALGIALTHANILDMLMLSAEIYACCLGLPVLWMLWHPQGVAGVPTRLVLSISPLVYGVLKLLEGVLNSFHPPWLVGLLQGWYQDSLSLLTLLIGLGVLIVYRQVV
ncbi:MAG: sodium:solute symporter family transporter, partial [Vampirovibrionales bacterium]